MINTTLPGLEFYDLTYANDQELKSALSSLAPKSYIEMGSGRYVSLQPKRQLMATMRTVAPNWFDQSYSPPPPSPTVVDPIAEATVLSLVVIGDVFWSMLLLLLAHCLFDMIRFAWMQRVRRPSDSIPVGRAVLVTTPDEVAVSVPALTGAIGVDSIQAQVLTAHAEAYLDEIHRPSGMLAQIGRHVSTQVGSASQGQPSNSSASTPPQAPRASNGAPGTSLPPQRQSPGDNVLYMV